MTGIQKDGVFRTCAKSAGRNTATRSRRRHVNGLT
nr:MAG TPA: hypothetical protein [Caudoviricetes sp.]